jgi:Calcineurin-like phosphoesterase
MNIKLFGFCLWAIPMFCFGQSIVRGPYLQVRNQTGIQIRYSTNVGILTQVKYGLTPSNLNLSVNSTDYKTNHVAQISALTHSTKYYYGIYNGTTKLQGNADNFFITTQPKGSEQKMSIWVTGDCGTGHPKQTQIKNSFLNYVGNQYMDAWLLLGDNAYNDGTEDQYQASFFNIYQNDRIMKQTTIYPAPGNHDYSFGVSRVWTDHNVPYYNIFAPVKNAEMGGVASNHKEYYSYDIGNVHFVSLDSYGQETANNYVLADTLSPQVVWLKQDLAANTQKFTIVYWHHAPYTMGTHNSDNETDLVAIRQKLVPIIERYNVDFVLTSHSHNYERSKLIKGHFGNEATFNSAVHVVNSSTGYYDGSTNSCAYHKKSNGSIKGTVYMVSGSAGGVLYTQTATFPHDALPITVQQMGGSLLIEVEGDRLDLKMIGEDGTVQDKFTMVKDMNQTRTVNVPLGANTFTIKSPYNEPTKWLSTAQLVPTLTIEHPVKGMVFQVEDLKNCFKDTLILNTIDPCLASQTINCFIEPTSNVDLKTSATIIAQSMISTNTNILFDAKRSIELKPGFETKPGTIFSAKIGGCN